MMVIEYDEECPNVTNHTTSPDGYNQWHLWAEKKFRRHKQVKCPTCGLYVIWIRRGKNEPDYGIRRESHNGF